MVQKNFQLDVRFEDYKAAQKRLGELQEAAMLLGGASGSTPREVRVAAWKKVDAQRVLVDEMRPRLIPEIGMPCTVIYYSDRSSAEVVEILSPKKIVVKQNGVYSGSCVFTYRRNGHWVLEGTTSRDWGKLLALGYADNYYDLSF